MSVLPPIEEKAAYVEQMFARIAPGYDRMNRVMTGGLDRGWRECAVAAAAPPAGGRALDIGSGTGDFLLELAGWMPDGLVVGVDFTVPMMRAGLPKLDRYRGQAAFAGGDALQLPFPDETFDAITTGFTMRNVTDVGRAFREMWRVARPGCVLACLEVARPRSQLLRLGHRLYFERVVPLLARALGADSTAYTYLPQSARAFPPPDALARISQPASCIIRAFPPPDALARIMQEAGWEQVRYTLLGLGAAAVHTGIKMQD